MLIRGNAINRALRGTLAVILAGGRGTRLHDLTQLRSKPAVPFAGKYRIIDFTLSNCINSGLRGICVLTQYRAHSLIQHIEQGWTMSRPEFGEFLEILPAQEREPSSSWYQGTADAVYQNLDIIRDHRPRHVLILAGDHIYKMDFSAMIAAHLEHGAAVTVACVNVPLEQAHQFGVVQTAADGQITGFQEKPAVPLARADRPGWALGSMGIYLFDADFLYAVLAADARDGTSRHDFGADILPGIHPHYRVFACPFVDEATGADAYWRDVGTLDAYWAANLELAGVTPPLNLYDEDWPIRTIARQLPPAKFVFDEDDRRGIAIDSLVAGGCIVSGARIRRCVLSNNVHVDQGAELTDTVVLPDARIGAYSFIRNAVIDVACHIAPHTVIGFDTHADARRFHVSAGGVVLVCPHMLGQVARHAS